MRSRNLWFTALVSAAFCTLPLFAQKAPEPEVEVFRMDAAHSAVAFKVRHLVTMVGGLFSDFSGTVTLPDREKPTLASVRFTAKVASISTANTQRDDHLKGPDFFDVEKFPEISFESTKVAPMGAGSFLVHGKFTLHGVTKEITLPVEFAGFVKDPWGGERAGLSIQTTLNRKDYGISWNKVLDSGGFVLGEEVKISIDLELVKENLASP